MMNHGARDSYYAVMFVFGVIAVFIFGPAFACGGCLMGRKFPAQRAACEKGDAAKCLEAGRLYEESGYEGTLSYSVFGPDDHAARAYQRGCALGSLEGCRKFGWNVATYELSALAPDAVRALTGACEAKDTGSCYLLGYMIGRGAGTPRDPARAAALCTQTCDAGANNACYVLASLYDLGTGVPKDEKKATELLQRSCAADYEPACRCQREMKDHGWCEWDSNALRYIKRP